MSPYKAPIASIIFFYHLVLFFCLKCGVERYPVANQYTDSEIMTLNIEEGYNYSCFKGLVFAIQNCNSLNMSHSTKQNQNIKIEALTGLKADICLLCDLRLGNKNLTNSSNDVKKLFLVNQNGSYDLIANSSQNKRGVGILLNRNLPYTIIEQVSDPGENFILLKIDINGGILILGALYGPNEHNPGFFIDLFRGIQRLGDHPIILGGDFNCTFSMDKINTNIDCMFMNDLPNYRHSKYVNDLCHDLNLSDPFRYLSPSKREFSYKPFRKVRKNRSRIDFFLVSQVLLSENSECWISDTVQGSFFDHKTVFLKIDNKPVRKFKKDS
jgi:exonuclease III